MALHVVIANLFIVTVLAVAAWRGAAPERSCAVIFTARLVITPAYHLLLVPARFNTVDPGMVAIDFAVFVALLWLALRANRMWPLWVTAAQLIVLFGHVSVLLATEGMQRAYWAMTQVPELIELFVLLVGTIAHRIRFKRLGTYPDWRAT